MQAKEQKIPIVYRRSEEYHSLPVSGAYGGTAPQGMVFCNLYTESPPMPENAELLVKPDGSVEQKPEKVQPGIVREFIAGLHMTPQVAISLGNWLVNHGNLALKAIKEVQTQTGETENE